MEIRLLKILICQLKVIKEKLGIFRSFLCTSFNRSIKTSKFSQYPKLADITPLYKKDKTDQKENYTPVSIWLNFSKIFERCIFKQMSQFFESTLCMYVCISFTIDHKIIIIYIYIYIQVC